MGLFAAAGTLLLRRRGFRPELAPVLQSSGSSTARPSSEPRQPSPRRGSPRSSRGGTPSCTGCTPVRLDRFVPSATTRRPRPPSARRESAMRGTSHRLQESTPPEGGRGALVLGRPGARPESRRRWRPPPAFHRERAAGTLARAGQACASPHQTALVANRRCSPRARRGPWRFIASGTAGCEKVKRPARRESRRRFQGALDATRELRSRCPSANSSPGCRRHGPITMTGSFFSSRFGGVAQRGGSWVTRDFNLAEPYPRHRAGLQRSRVWSNG